MMVDSFLPSMRALVAKRLKEEGMSQGKVASLLGLTQASVSSYLSAPSSKKTAALSSLGVTAEEAETYAALLAEDLKKNPTYAVATLYSIWTRLVGGGDACALHRSEHPSLATCEVCMNVFGSRKGRSEGAVVRVRGQARSVMRPECGASTPLAAILLEVARMPPDLRAAMNLRYDERMSQVLARLRVRRLTMGRSYPTDRQDKVLEAMRERLSRPGGDSAFEAVVDLGGEGVEPSLYLFAADATKVVRRSLEIARAYAASG